MPAQKIPLPPVLFPTACGCGFLELQISRGELAEKGLGRGDFEPFGIALNGEYPKAIEAGKAPHPQAWNPPAPRGGGDGWKQIGPHVESLREHADDGGPAFCVHDGGPLLPRLRQRTYGAKCEACLPLMGDRSAPDP